MQRDIDRIFERAARAPHRVNQSVLDRITTSVHSSLAPVQPLPATRTLTLRLLLLCAAVALGGAARLGFFGFQALGLAEGVTILSVLVALACLAARECVSWWIPASRHYLGPGPLVALACVALLCTFGLFLRDYHAERFFSAGIVCLSVGVLHAIPAACLASWLLRRGFLVDVVSGGAIAGALGGIGGVAMLELHCPNLEAPHVLLWHAGVVPLSAMAGALVGWAIDARRSHILDRRGNRSG